MRRMNATESLAPIAWQQYTMFQRGLFAPPPLIWTEPELSAAGFTPTEVVSYTMSQSEAILASKISALEVLYPPSSRSNREPVRAVHALVFETNNKPLLPLLLAVAKVHELTKSDPGFAAKERYVLFLFFIILFICARGHRGLTLELCMVV